MRSSESPLLKAGQADALAEDVGVYEAPGRYLHIGEHSRGGMGRILLMHDQTIGRDVALKEPLPGGEISGADAPTPQSTATTARFLREARLTAQLEHPSIVPIYELGYRADGTVYYTMKMVRGTPWNRVIQELPLERNLEILLSVADAVAFAHSRGIIHRDLKPHNVMLGDFGEVLVVDWGLSMPYTIPTGVDGLCQDAGPAGSPNYMAPEMAYGVTERLGPHSDIYLLGAILFEALRGHPPHRGDTLEQCLASAVKNRLPSADEHDELMQIALRAMATTPEDRYVSVKAFQEALREYRSHTESNLLADRAEELKATADLSGSYDGFSKALFTYQEALRLWGGNQRAEHGLRAVRLAYASAATEHGDLDLAYSVLEAGRLMKTPLAAHIQTLRKQRAGLAEEHAVLRADAEKWSTAFLLSPDTVIIARLSDRRLLEANDRFFHVLGYTREEMLGASLDDLELWARPEDREVYERMLIEQGGRAIFETTVRKRDGRLLQVLVSARLIEIGGVRAVIANARDISERKEAENALRKSAFRLTETQRLAHLSTWELDLKTGHINLSEATYEMAGISSDEEAPTLERYLQIIHPEDIPKFQAALECTLEKAKDLTLELRQKRRDGVYYYVLVRGLPIVEGGAVTGIFGIAINITEHKRLEEALEAAQRRCRELEARLTALGATPQPHEPA